MTGSSTWSATIFAAAGCGPAEHARIAHYLVEANLVGHDSHGVIRVPAYIDWLRAGKVLANQTLKIVFENAAIAVVDGQFGFGQVMGEEAMKLGIDKAGAPGRGRGGAAELGPPGPDRRLGRDGGEGGQGLAPLRQHQRRRHPGRPLRGHPAPALGQPDRGGRAGPGRPADHRRHLDLHDRRGQDQGRLQQGREGPRRLHPRRRGPADQRPQGVLRLASRGDPAAGRAQGIRPGVVAEMLAGAFSGGACSHFGVDRVSNNMLSIILDPAFFQSAGEFSEEVRGFITHVKSSRTVTPDGEILMPGEPEARARAEDSRWDRDRRHDVGPDRGHGRVARRPRRVKRTRLMSDAFANRVALVTGGSRGIGRATALRLAGEGADVAISYASRSRQAEQVVAEIQALGRKAICIPCNVARPDDVGRLVSRTRERLGPIDVLAHCGAISNICDHTGLSYELWLETIDVNLNGAFLVVFAVKDEMIARDFGRIVLVSSVAALRPRKMQIHYASSKAGVIALTRCCAEAFAPHNVRVNCVAPGLIETEMARSSPDEAMKRIVADTPMGRIGQPEEIAAVIRFLLSEESSFMTGETLSASGGRVTLP